ncbi:MAG: RNA polymerase sigma factor [Candidatus Nitrohelix vancouverensis]|uniref:RNA polymerase sigma factor n=1 Tax=Candidatus Nitrohelix vancouverensis TaxID=2705534 RepID=A0A7T0C1A5_9BACT|nr:MAG: RNA polymerase sigma factor [Candidatus Nitrohelix vancouverensis]
MEQFLASVERRAFRIAEIATGNSEEALDIVQDAMIALARRYAEKSEQEWRPLFFTILQNGIRDWHRRAKVRNGIISLFSGWKRETASEDPIAQYADPEARDPGDALMGAASVEAVHHALRQLPLRQQQVFLLRAWEELSIAETARAMKISEGSVKTHYSRATEKLRSLLKDHQ